MNLLWRRITYLSFFAIFFIVSIGLLLYLQGYRYNYNKQRLERVGAIMADSLPKDARVKINNVYQTANTTSTIQPLTPESYQVEIELPRHQLWKKTLNVKPSEVTFTGQVRLWPNTQTGELIVDSQAKNIQISPNRENIIYELSGGLKTGLWLLNLNIGQPSLLSRPATSTITDLEWSPTSRHFLVAQIINNKKTWHVYNLADGTWLEVQIPDDIKPVLVHWGESDNEIFISTGAELYRQSLRNNKPELVWAERLKDWRWHDSLIFGLTYNNNKGVSVKILNLSNNKNVALENSPTFSDAVRFFEKSDDWLPLYDYDRHNLYLLHSPLTIDQPIRRLPEVTSVDWSSDYNQLLLGNNFEIWSYDIQEDRLNLVQRLSSTLSSPLYYAKEPYIIYAQGKDVYALELDNRPEQQRWLLSRHTDDVEALYLDPTGRNLTIKTKQGLWRMTLAPVKKFFE